MTRGLAEMMKIGVAFGAKESTFYGLSGLGDLILTCNSKKSRNLLIFNKIIRKFYSTGPPGGNPG